MNLSLKGIAKTLNQVYLSPSIGKTVCVCSSINYSTQNQFEPNHREIENQKRMIAIEMQLLRDSGEFFVPTNVTEKHWRNLLPLTTRYQRLSYYRYMKKLELANEKKIRLKAENEIKYFQRIEQHNENDHIQYGLRRNNMFYKIRKPTMNRFYNGNIANSILFGQKLIIDLGYQENMDERETKSCIRQLTYLYSCNRNNRDPFDLYLCNIKENSDFDKKLCKSIGNLRAKTCLATVTEKSYLDFFSKEKLVYLTPDCVNDLTEFNYDDIYIIGALVDHGPFAPITLAKARREGLRMAKLPLDKFLRWEKGQKALTLDQIHKILLTAKNQKSWRKALEHIPQRKMNAFAME